MKEELHISSDCDGFALHCCSPMVRGASHHHDELEVNLVVSGAAAYLLGRERLPLVAGSLIWLFPEQEHLLIDCSNDFSLWVVVFKPKLVERHALQPARHILRSPDPGSILCRQLDSGVMDTLVQVYQNAAIGEADIEFANTAIAYALVTSWQAFLLSPVSIVRTDVHPAVAKALHIITETDEAIPLAKLARQAGLSASRLSRLFKKQTNISLTAFRHQQCLKRFLRIYRTGVRYSLTEAALLAGFGSYVQFHRIFRRHMGKSPAEYRRTIQQGAVG